MRDFVSREAICTNERKERIVDDLYKPNQPDHEQRGEELSDENQLHAGNLAMHFAEFGEALPFRPRKH